MLSELSLSMPTLTQLGFAIGILVVAWAVSMIVLFGLKYSKKLTSLTDSTLDDEIVRLIRRPVHLGFQFVGILLALNYLFPALSYKEFGYAEMIPILLIVWIAYLIDRLIRGVMDWYQQEATKSDADGQKRGTFGFLNTLISMLVWGIDRKSVV